MSFASIAPHDLKETPRRENGKAFCILQSTNTTMHIGCLGVDHCAAPVHPMQHFPGMEESGSPVFVWFVAWHVFRSVADVIDLNQIAESPL
ncbi:MAG TPA: hypothetical protein VLC92_02590 [Rhodocyclaceae bacterium]|nr:hypothetical protein [Rhodocyclaceae bacterium]